MPDISTLPHPSHHVQAPIDQVNAAIVGAKGLRNRMLAGMGGVLANAAAVLKDPTVTPDDLEKLLANTEALLPALVDEILNA